MRLRLGWTALGLREQPSPRACRRTTETAEMETPSPPSKPSPKQTLTGEYQKDKLFRILSLDGGGSKGFYTLGVLKEIEGVLKCPLYQCFDLIFGTSTGSIIASLLALGFEVDEIHHLYREHVPSVMR